QSHREKRRKGTRKATISCGCLRLFRDALLPFCCREEPPCYRGVALDRARPWRGQRTASRGKTRQLERSIRAGTREDLVTRDLSSPREELRAWGTLHLPLRDRLAAPRPPALGTVQDVQRGSREKAIRDNVDSKPVERARFGEYFAEWI